MLYIHDGKLVPSAKIYIIFMTSYLLNREPGVHYQSLHKVRRAAATAQNTPLTYNTRHIFCSSKLLTSVHVHTPSQPPNCSHKSEGAKWKPHFYGKICHARDESNLRIHSDCLFKFHLSSGTVTFIWNFDTNSNFLLCCDRLRYTLDAGHRQPTWNLGLLLQEFRRISS